MGDRRHDKYTKSKTNIVCLEAAHRLWRQDLAWGMVVDIFESVGCWHSIISGRLRQGMEEGRCRPWFRWDEAWWGRGNWNCRWCSELWVTYMTLVAITCSVFDFWKWTFFTCDFPRLKFALQKYIVRWFWTLVPSWRGYGIFC
jgi:hypothetical protein